MKRWITTLGLALAALTGYAQVAPILLEACNAMEPSSKRMECLRAANRPGGASGGGALPGSMAQSAYAAAPAAAVARAKPSNSSGNSTCFTGPRGGTYTITASGRKNYAGC